VAGTLRLITPVLAAASVFTLVIGIAFGQGGADGRPSPSAVSVPPPIPVANSTPTTPGSSVSQPAEQSSAPTTVPEPPSGYRRFTLSLTGQHVTIDTNVAPYKAKQGADGMYEPVDPPHYGTAVWIEQYGFPTDPGTGTVYVYGHACHHHICPFTAIQHHAGGYTVHAGDQMIVTTSTGVLTYQVCAVGSSPKKSGSLQEPTCGTHVSKDLVLVTCEYGSGDTSEDNIVVVASLVTATKR